MSAILYAPQATISLNEGGYFDGSAYGGVVELAGQATDYFQIGSGESQAILLRVPESPPAASIDPSFKLGNVFAFPNPALSRNPTIHIEVGVADSVDVRIYDKAGDLRYATALGGAPMVLMSGGQTKYAYETTWDASNVGSDVYVYLIDAKKNGYPDIKVMRKLAVVK